MGRSACPGCGGDVSDRATRCRHCFAALPPRPARSGDEDAPDDGPLSTEAVLWLAFLPTALLASFTFLVMARWIAPELAVRIDNPWRFLFSLAAIQAFVMLLVTGAAGFARDKLAREPVVVVDRIPPIPVLVLFCAGGLAVNVGYTFATRALGFGEDAQARQLVEKMAGALHGADLFLAVAALGVVGPLAEELFFRGFLQRTLAVRAPVVAAVLVTSVVFGAFHGNVWQGIGAGLLGLYYGWVLQRTASLAPSIACHMANNSLVVLLQGGPDVAAACVGTVTAAVFGSVAWVGLRHFRRGQQR